MIKVQTAETPAQGFLNARLRFVPDEEDHLIFLQHVRHSYGVLFSHVISLVRVPIKPLLLRH